MANEIKTMTSDILIKNQALRMPNKNLKDKFISNMLTYAKLYPNNVDKLIGPVYQATLLDLPLEPSFGYAYIIPYSGNFQFQMGYKGYIQLALRTGKYRTIASTDVREGEIVSHDRLKGTIFKWNNTSKRNTLPIIGYVAYIEFSTGGFSKQLYMSKEEIIDHFKKYSAAYKQNSSFPITDFETMALKTVLKLLLKKYGILSVELQQVLKNDSASLDLDLKPTYIDNPDSNIPPVRDWQSRQNENYKVVVGEPVKEEFIGEPDVPTTEVTTIIDEEKSETKDEEKNGGFV